MIEWMGYEQLEDTFAGKPWWTWVKRDSLQDGGIVQLRRKDIGSLCAVWMTGPSSVRYRFNGGLLVGEFKDTEQVLEYLDRTYPMPVPPARCLQVWKVGEEPAFTLVCEGPTPLAAKWVDQPKRRSEQRSITSYAELSPQWEWPPPGACLVAGPGAPWAPPKPKETPDG